MPPPLHTETIRAPDASPDRTIRMLHGIYGRGRNLRRFATMLVESNPEWAAELVDLRGHGESPELEPPHTVEAAAEDVIGLGPAPDVLLGHSYGGKVALLTLHPGFEADQVWVVDASPSKREPGGLPWEMLGHLRAHGGPFDDRSEAVSALEGDGVPRMVAQWMATNLERGDDGRLRWSISPDLMEALLRSYFREDAWDVVEDRERPGAIHFVRASGSSVIGEEEARRIRAAGEASDVALHEVEGGHWLHADNPEGLLEVVERYLPT